MEEYPQQGEIPLTVFDVYRWLEDEQLFPRSSSVKRPSATVLPHSSAKQSFSAIAAPDAFCARCGLLKAHHSVPAIVKTEAEDPVLFGGGGDEGAHSSASFSLNMLTSPCASFVQAVVLPPILDIKHFLGPSLVPTDTSGSPYSLTSAIFSTRSSKDDRPLHVDSADIVACADPSLVSSIEELLWRWDIHSFERPSAENTGDNVGEDKPLADRTMLHRPRSDVFAHTAPSALLALLTQSMVKLLVRRGVESFRQDESSSSGPRERQDRSRRRGAHVHTPPTQKQTPGSARRRLLTPSHIFRGLASAGRSEVLDASALVALSRFGESVHSEVAIGISSMVSTDRGDANTGGPVGAVIQNSAA